MRSIPEPTPASQGKGGEVPDRQRNGRAAPFLLWQTPHLKPSRGRTATSGSRVPGTRLVRATDPDGPNSTRPDPIGPEPTRSTKTRSARYTTELRRPKQGRMVAGVAAGIADRLGVERWVVRLAFVLLSAGGGSGVLLYVAAWLLMPEEGESVSVGQRWANQANSTRPWIGVLLVLIAAAILFSNLPFFDGGLLFPDRPAGDRDPALPGRPPGNRVEGETSRPDNPRPELRRRPPP